MSRQSPDATVVGQLTSSLVTKMLNIFVTPGLVFKEVVAAPPRMINWIVPVALVSLSCLATLGATISPDTVSAAARQLLEADKIAQSQVTLLSGQWSKVSRAMIIIAPFAGTIWSAFVLWFIGKVFLKSRFPFRKALEITALSGTILLLGAIVTWLLVAATGDASARPALSLFCLKLPQESTFRNACGLVDAIQLWSTGVLAIGLSKLAAVTLKESAFWVFGYWFALRAALILLA